MTLVSKLYIFFALSLAALAVQIPLRESDSALGSYSPPESEMVTCSVNTTLVDHRGRVSFLPSESLSVYISLMPSFVVGQATWYEPGKL